MVLRINRPANLVEAWCFSDRKGVNLLYTDYRNNAKLAVRTGQAGKIMHRSARAMKGYCLNGVIHLPEISYGLDGEFKPGRRWWGEHNLMELHDYLMTIGYGHPRKDGKITPYKLPSKAEIRAAFNNSTILYVKGKDGEFVPLFEQPKW